MSKPANNYLQAPSAALYYQHMSDHLHVDLEIVVSKSPDNYYIAQSPAYPNLMGKGKTDKMAIKQLGQHILRVSNDNMKKMLNQLFDSVSKFKKTLPKEKPANDISNLLFHIKMPLVNDKISQIELENAESELDFEMQNDIASQMAEDILEETLLNPELFMKEIPRQKDNFFTKFVNPQAIMPPSERIIIIGPTFSFN